MHDAISISEPKIPSTTEPAAFSVLLEDSIRLAGLGIHRLLRGLRHAVVFLLTAGAFIDAALAKLTSEDFAEAYFLDGVASSETYFMTPAKTTFRRVRF